MSKQILHNSKNCDSIYTDPLRVMNQLLKATVMLLNIRAINNDALITLSVNCFNRYCSNFRFLNYSSFANVVPTITAGNTPADVQLMIAFVIGCMLYLVICSRSRISKSYK